MNDYLKFLATEKNNFLAELRQHADSANVPILRADAAALMRVMTTLRSPRRILEAGTAVGYSAILMATCCHNSQGECIVNIDTVELDMDTAVIAKENIRKAGYEKNIRVIVGDAGEVFSCLGGSEVYDMIFVDSAKSQYIEMYDDIKRLLKPGGLLVCDNVIFYGKIFDEPEKAPHKHRTIISNLRAFLEKLTSDDDYTTSVIETGDGMTISVKRKD